MRRALRAMAGSVFLATVGLLVQNKFHGLSLGTGFWLVLTWIALGFALLLWLLTEEALRERRYTLHVGVRDGQVGLWVRRPERPTFATRHARRQAAKREIAIGRRAIEVGARALVVYSQAHIDSETDRRERNWSASEFAVAIERIATTLQQQVGPAWLETLADLRSVGLDPDARAITEQTQCFDQEAIDVQACGRMLLRRHEINPDE